jgi:glyoxylase-like metal-dependent hydrolase (beta-lactamase superfamily II)
MSTTVKTFFDSDTWTLTYVVSDPETKDAVVIDPVLNYDPASSSYDYSSVDQVDAYIKEQGLNVHYLLETHAHADHLTGSQILKERFPSAKIAIGANIKAVQSTFKHIFNFKDFNENGVQFDQLLDDNELVKVGSLEIKVLYTPGHTPACASYYINNEMVFTGDVIFMHDFGTGRCDFPGGSAEDMYHSITERLYTLPDNTRVFVGHDYMPGGRELKYESTIDLQKQHNPQLKGNTTKEAFIKFRTDRDKQLKAPNLLLQSLQVNIDAGHLPKSEDNGTPYLKMPLRKK